MGYDIAVLYICTGNYTVFWKDFHASAERFFLTNHEKHYYVFTDAQSDSADYPSGKNVEVVHQEKLGWPHDTLKRFKMFLRIEDRIRTCDYVYFFNANMLFIEPVNEEILPGRDDGGLLAVKHPGYYLDSRWVYPYETNRKSLAYAPKRLGRHYYMGGLNGGTASAYLDMVRELDRNIDDDEARGIIARWHDESHLNRYLLQRRVKVLGPEYGVPEGMALKGISPRILIRDKAKWGGHHALRDVARDSRGPSLLTKIKRLSVFVFRSVYRGLGLKKE